MHLRTLVLQEDLDFKAALELSLEARLVVGALQVMHVMHTFTLTLQPKGAKTANA